MAYRGCRLSTGRSIASLVARSGEFHTAAACANSGSGTGTAGAAPTKKTMFFGSVELDPLKAKLEFSDVAEEVLMLFTQKPGVKVAAQIGRYAHAKQFKRMKKAVRTLRTRVGRVHREVTRQLHLLPEVAKAKVQDLLQRTGRILTQRTKDKNKLYALHAPEVECISKGKARTPYEFGVKVSIATTLKEGLVVGMRSMPGNPYDGHTLAETLEQVGILTGTDKPPTTAIVDKGWGRKGGGRAHSDVRPKARHHPNAQGHD